MTAGLVGAQAAHCSQMFMFETLKDGGNFSDVERNWMLAPVTSVLAVDTPEELQVVIDLAKEKGVKCHVWKDTIPSKIFAGRFLDVVVGCAIGPDDDEKVKQVTGTLPLF